MLQLPSFLSRRSRRSPENEAPPSLGNVQYRRVQAEAVSAWRMACHQDSLSDEGAGSDSVEDAMVSLVALSYFKRMREGRPVTTAAITREKGRVEMKAMLEQAARTAADQFAFVRPSPLDDEPARIAAIIAMTWAVALRDPDYRRFFLLRQAEERQTAITDWINLVTFVIKNGGLSSPRDPAGPSPMTIVRLMAGADPLLLPDLCYCVEKTMPDSVALDIQARRTGEGLKTIGEMVAKKPRKSLFMRRPVLPRGSLEDRVEQVAARMRPLATMRGYSGVPAALYDVAVRTIALRVFTASALDFQEIARDMVARSSYMIDHVAARLMLMSVLPDVIRDPLIERHISRLETHERDRLSNRWRGLLASCLGVDAVTDDMVGLLSASHGSPLLLEGVLGVDPAILVSHEGRPHVPIAHPLAGTIP